MHYTVSPLEFKLLQEKITMKQINNLSYTEISHDYENDPCQVVFFSGKSYR